MRTNGFALFVGEGAGSRAVEEASRVERFSKGVVAWAGGEFGPLSEARLEGEKEVVLAYTLGGAGFPLVHGVVEEGAGGEYSILGRGAAGFYGERDSLGTRGLWTEGDSMASDYRLLGAGARLVTAGGRFESGETSSGPAREPEKLDLTFEEAGRELASLLGAVVRGRVAGRRRVAVSFSGGLDSSLLALLASRHAEVVLCSAFAPGSRDEEQTGRAAGLLGMELKSAVLDQDEVARLTREAMLPPGESTPMDLALWSIYSTTSLLASEAGAETILLGQLADELFGGYSKYAARARDGGEAEAERMMKDDARSCAERGLLRDEAACSARAEAMFPYADERVASFAWGLPFGFKVREGERKAVLREAAAEAGLPEELARAPKKAAQYSSGAAKLVGRL